MSVESANSRFEGIDRQIIQMREDMSDLRDSVRAIQSTRARETQRVEDLMGAFESVVDSLKAQRTALYTVGTLIVVAALTVLAVGHA